MTIRIYITSILLIFGVSKPLLAQKISGHVLTEAGKPAYYVTVKFDKSNSVFTNTDGSFIITAKKLPDTLFFTAPGFEPYHVLVTDETAKDPNFEVVLLVTRRKIKSADVGKTLNQINSNTSYRSTQGTPSPTAGSYIAGKKLLMIDSASDNGSVVYRSGLLTAGENNDFTKWKMWEDFGETDFKTQSDHWGLYPLNRYSVQLQNSNYEALVGRPVYLINHGDTVWSAISDNTGKAELWADMARSGGSGDYKISSPDADDLNSPCLFSEGINQITAHVACSASPAIDVEVVVDATGSMSNEIDFLKIELEEVLRNTFAEYSDLNVHVGSVFYRDRGDEYLTRHIDFQTDLVKVLNFIKLQRASGGGDVPEAVHTALQTALDSSQWSSSARARILFLVTDAPPHDEAREKIFKLIKQAAKMGVRIVPVICRGADKSTEFVMRSMALGTNGTYVFLTDDVNAEFVNSVATPHTFNVQFLNSLLESIIKQMVFTNSCGEGGDYQPPKGIPANAEGVTVSKLSAEGTVTIESKQPLQDLFIADFAGKILTHVMGDKQLKRTINVASLPDGIYFVKYITPSDHLGAVKIELKR